MGNVIIIPENLMAMPGASVTAGSEASASYAANNMLTERPSKRWRSTSQAPSHAYAYFSLPGGAFSVNAVALVRHNLYRGDQYRFFTDASTFLAGYTGYNPTGTVAGTTTNTTSTYADVANGETTPGATFAGPTNSNLAWSLGLSFATPSVAPVTGADKQAFWVYLKATPTSTSYCTVNCWLYENGVPVADLGTRRIASSTGQWLCFPWDASSLGTASGANVECYLYMTKISVANYVQVGSVVWACDALARTNDSGWQTYSPFSGSGITYKPVVEGKGNVLLYQIGSTINPATVHVQLRLSQSPLDYSALNERLPTPDGYAAIGTVVMGEVWQPAINISHGKLAGVVDPSPRRRTYGGGLFGSRRPTRRVVAVNVGHQTKTEAHTILDRVLWRHGLMKPFVVSTLPDDATQSKATTLFGHLRNAENWLNVQPDEGYENNFSLEFEEVL